MDERAMVLISWLAGKPVPPRYGTAFPGTIGFSRIKFVSFAISPSVFRSLHALGTLPALNQVYSQPCREHTAFLSGLMPQ